MSKNAERLVKKLAQRGVIIHGVSFHISRDQAQERLNTIAGTDAPTWYLLANPLWDTVTGHIVANGERPHVDFPNGCKLQMEVYGFQPLTHILKTPLEQWDVDVDELKRLLVNTNVTPDSWRYH